VICGASDHKEQGGQPATSPAFGQSHRESRAALGQHFVQYGLAPDFSIPLCPYVLIQAVAVGGMYQLPC